MARQRKKPEGEVVILPEEVVVESQPKFISVFARLWHPYQEKYIPTDTPAELEYDSWTKCQVEAGLLKEVK